MYFLLRNLSEAHPESKITAGFDGAIQKLLINADIMEKLVEKAVGGKGVQRYYGPPCSSSSCQNGGVCHPYLNRFICKCPPEFEGKFCEHRE